MIVGTGPATKTGARKTKIKRELNQDDLDYTKEELQAFLRMKQAATTAVSRTQVDIS